MSNFTVIKRIDINQTNDIKYCLEVKFNSYKDGDITVDIMDSNSFSVIDIPLIEIKKDTILTHVIMPIKKVLKNNSTKFNYELRELIKDVYTCINHAKSFKGKMTNDYDIHNCHSMLKFSTYS